MPERLSGRLVGSVEAVWNGEPGVYCPVRANDGTIMALWFKLPTGSLGRIAARGYGEGGPEWEITDDEVGTISVEPSIQQPEVSSSNPPIQPWHGYLRNGVWYG